MSGFIEMSETEEEIMNQLLEDDWELWFQDDPSQGVHKQIHDNLYLDAAPCSRVYGSGNGISFGLWNDSGSIVLTKDATAEQIMKISDKLTQQLNETMGS